MVGTTIAMPTTEVESGVQSMTRWKATGIPLPPHFTPAMEEAEIGIHVTVAVVKLMLLPLTRT